MDAVRKKTNLDTIALNHHRSIGSILALLTKKEEKKRKL